MPRKKANEAVQPWTVGAVRVRRVRGPRADGDVYWRATLNGEQLWAGWGRRQDPALSRELAKLAAEPASEPGPGGLPGPLVRHLLGAWKAHQQARRQAEEISKRSLQIYEQALRWLSRGLGDVRIDALDGTVVRSYLRARLDGHIQLPDRELGKGKGARKSWHASSQTMANELAVLRWVWAWGRLNGHAAADLDIPNVKVKAVREKYTPTRGEIRAVLEQLRPWQVRMVMLLAATGARRSEIANLRWRDVDVPRGEITLHKAKTGPRVVPLTIDLGPPGAPDDLVLGVAITTAESISDDLGQACERAGVRRWTPHALRRLALDELYESGADVGVVRALLGQSVTVAISHYRQPRPQSLRRAVERARLGELPAGEVVPFPVTGGRHSGE
ncbi:MAG TPA: tyrosine-type recombinase/integrase [Phycisphaerales bacterium]|nr:tyrosine-type recombinase/integrase [Phycisphaerales bacterium]